MFIKLIDRLIRIEEKNNDSKITQANQPWRRRKQMRKKEEQGNTFDKCNAHNKITKKTRKGR